MDKIKGYQSGEAPPPTPAKNKGKTKPAAPAKMDDLRKWENAIKDQKKKDANAGKASGRGDEPNLDADPSKRPDMQALRTLIHEIVDEHPFQPPHVHKDDQRSADGRPKDKDSKDDLKPSDITPMDADSVKRDPGVSTADLVFATPKAYFATPVPLKLMEYTDPSRISASLADEKKGGIAAAGEAAEGAQRGQMRADFEKKEMERDASIVGVGILQQMNQAAAAPFVPELAQTPPVPSQELQDRVERMAERLMVTDPRSGQKPEIVLQLDSKFLHGSELALRMEGNELVVSLRSTDQKALRSLEGMTANLQRDVEQALTQGMPNLRVRVDLQLRPN